MTQAASSTEEFSLRPLVEFAITNLRTLLYSGAVCAALAAVAVVLSPRDFTASAVFLPQSGSDASQAGLRALAGQFGISVGSASSGQSPDLYAEVLTSMPFLSAVVSDPLRDDSATSLAELYGITSETDSARRVEELAHELRENMSVTVSRKTGAVMVSVTSADRSASLELVKRLLSEVERFNLESRKSQAGAERAFAEERYQAAARDLRDAEDALSRFLERNRQFSSSPTLSFERDRLEREVSLRQQLVVSLSQALEEARLREVRDTPLISLVSDPFVSVDADSRYVVLKVLVAAFLGVSISFVVLLAMQVRSIRIAPKPPN